MLIAEILLNMIDDITEETAYSLTVAEIVELIEVANKGYVIGELFADEDGLFLTLIKSGNQKVVATYPSVTQSGNI